MKGSSTIKKKCKHCKRGFYTKRMSAHSLRKENVYCGIGCMAKDYGKNAIVVECRVCGKKKKRSPSQNTYKYCSQECYHTTKRDKKRPNHSLAMKGNNFNLGKKITQEQRDKLRGPNHWRYGKGKGRNDLSKKIRSLPEYNQWRLSVYSRDNFSCTDCKKSGVRLECHHIKSYSSIIEENNITSPEQALLCKILFATSNGLTLCIECHKKTHSYGRNKNSHSYKATIGKSRVEGKKI